MSSRSSDLSVCHKAYAANASWCSCLVIRGEIHMEWGERPTFLTTEMLHRRLLRKSLSTAVDCSQSHDQEAQGGNKKPPDFIRCLSLITKRRSDREHRKVALPWISLLSFLLPRTNVCLQRREKMLLHPWSSERREHSVLQSPRRHNHRGLITICPHSSDCPSTEATTFDQTHLVEYCCSKITSRNHFDPPAAPGPCPGVTEHSNLHYRDNVAVNG